MGGYVPLLFPRRSSFQRRSRCRRSIGSDIGSDIRELHRVEQRHGVFGIGITADGDGGGGHWLCWGSDFPLASLLGWRAPVQLPLHVGDFSPEIFVFVLDLFELLDNRCGWILVDCSRTLALDGRPSTE